MTINTSSAAQPAALDALITAACDRIAPTWPLDQFIAVNPYWGWRDSAAGDAAAHLAALAGTTLTMPRSWFRAESAAGRIAGDQVLAAAIELGDSGLAETAMAILEHPDGHHQPVISRMALVTDVRDGGSEPCPGQTWTNFVTHQISQHCGAHFDRWQGTWHPDHDAGLFTGWREQTSRSRGVTWRNGRTWAQAQLQSLPTDAESALAAMLVELRIPEAGHEAYLTALLLSVNGWAAWCAYRRWQARLGGADDNEIVDLLAIRLAWDWLLRADTGTDDDLGWDDWADSWAGAEDLVATIADEQRIDWLLQSAVERTYQATLIGALHGAGSDALTDARNDAEADPDSLPAVQAVFCIDVRSEVLRRALEAVTDAAHTRGFAGFFGLPISYTPVGSALTRPQLPGLLAPALNVTEHVSISAEQATLAGVRSATLGNRQRWSRFRSAPSSVFSFVESMGLLYGPKLIKDSTAHAHPPARWEDDGLPSHALDSLRPRLEMIDDDPAAAAAIAARVLRGMGLTAGFAPLVMLCGHGSQTANNPHSAGLDCGACGGQTGEVNARVVANLLNDIAVRAHLATTGISVPETTWFCPALHNTTTDRIELFDVDLAPAAKRSEIIQLQQWLNAAGRRARAERASSLGLGHLADDPERLERAVLERANDWSQVRPEWGLAGNAAFIVAPRERTRNINLEGRCFLHDYDWTSDADLSVLTLIMTAPMVVTNWINMQYHASTVDNKRYGSGNKVLHNVVGGRIGVFEGNGGDLRIGLSMQSLHDGEHLRHRPLRLSVFIEAPRAGIDSIIDEHAVVRDLVSNGWLHLLRIEPADGTVERRTRTGWSAAPYC